MKGIPEQYSRLKGECDGCMLLMQVGNFFLLFGEDAEAISQCSQVKLVPSGSMDNPVARAGIPVVALDKYVGKLLRSGRKLAIAWRDSFPGFQAVPTPPESFDSNRQ